MSKIFFGRLLLFLAFALLAGTAYAQNTVQLFGGYSYMLAPVHESETVQGACPVGTLPPCPLETFTLGGHPNLNGWELSGTYNPNKWLGATADFSRRDGSVEGSSVHMQTYLFGPQIRFPGPVSPFAHVLFGVAHETVGANSILGFNAVSYDAFAAAVGAGIDIKVAWHLSLRAIQLDYVVTRFDSATQSDARASAGIVLHF